MVFNYFDKNKYVFSVWNNKIGPVSMILLIYIHDFGDTYIPNNKEARIYIKDLMIKGPNRSKIIKNSTLLYITH